MKIKTAVLTISTRGSQGLREDSSGQIIKEMVEGIGAEVIDYQLIADEKEKIISELNRMVYQLQANLIITTGGTGLSPNDVTPEATLEVIDRRLPGFEEAMRMTGFQSTPYAILSRAVVGSVAQAIIVNLPGNPNAVKQGLAAIIKVIPHGIRVLSGGLVEDKDHKFDR